METSCAEHVLEIRRLEPSEYSAIEKVQEGYKPDPDHSVVIVAIRDGEIVGRTMLVRPFHIEGTWVDERFRKGTVGYRLIRKLESEARSMGLKVSCAYVDQPNLEDYMQRLGYTKSPMTLWTKEL